MGNQNPDYSDTLHGTRRFTGETQQSQVPFPAGCPACSVPIQSIVKLKNLLGLSQVTFSITSLSAPSIFIAKVTLGTEK